MTISSAVRQHYVDGLGPPSRTARFEVEATTVEVFKWSSDNGPEGVNLYATIAASAWPIVGHDANHRVEFFVGLLPAKDEVASALAALALYPRREGVALDHGDTVPADAPIWVGTDMRRFLVIRPRADIIPPLEVRDGLHVEFLQAIPIYESELVYKSAHTAEALLRLWEESGVRFWDPARPPTSA